jgi:hypothetical protein
MQKAWRGAPIDEQASTKPSQKTYLTSGPRLKNLPNLRDTFGGSFGHMRGRLAGSDPHFLSKSTDPFTERHGTLHRLSSDGVGTKLLRAMPQIGARTGHVRAHLVPGFFELPPG